MSATIDLLVGFAQIINTEGIGVWDPAGVYPDNTVNAVIIGPKLPESPSQLIGIRPYGVTAHPQMNDETLGVQFWLRGTRDSESVLATYDALFNVFEGMRDTVVNGVPLVLLSRQSFLPQPVDQNERHQLSVNFYAQISHPTRFRVDEN